ncbi:SRPBCC domain-containing protein [Crenobacter sp. SG2303]|uniref:SRPBCC domain-containing protein n=1 Tax=Crenobacter oryzisoli TaxID=3056844 RepID=A0ABT7XUZ4_9NEIS|nr:SRPBCC domain-containing protein [Crenobacter sp. SG2303]MDN0077626.1 SRPBCC domain-containing protein [Crenobacter sp. SG2303]
MVEIASRDWIYNWCRLIMTSLRGTLQAAVFNRNTRIFAMSDIVWPAEYLPGITDNYVSNKVIIPGLSASQVWPSLNDTTAWPSYYANVADIRFHDGSGPELSVGARFRFTTFSFPVEAEITEYVQPRPGQPARVAWHGWVEGDAERRLDVHHAWLIEDLSGGRVRVLTQETQIGQPAKKLAATKPNPMLNAHQDWLDGLIRHARAWEGPEIGASISV